jgi:DNA-binding NarL/FixJ family response regulator
MNPGRRLSGNIRVLVVEDQGLMAAFLRRWLAELPRFTLAGVARSGEEGLTLLETALPDIALVDLQLPQMDGLHFVQMARQVRPQLRALIVTSLTDPLTLTRVRESGVEGYIEKDATPEQLTAAIGAVADGVPAFSAVFSDTLARENAKTQGLAKILSRREQQVLAEVLAGRTSRAIGEQLGLSVRTVEFHRANLMTKLDATNLGELVSTVKQRGWVRAMATLRTAGHPDGSAAGPPVKPV